MRSPVQIRPSRPEPRLSRGSCHLGVFEPFRVLEVPRASECIAWHPCTDSSRSRTAGGSALVGPSRRGSAEKVQIRPSRPEPRLSRRFLSLGRCSLFSFSLLAVELVTSASGSVVTLREEDRSHRSCSLSWSTACGDDAPQTASTIVSTTTSSSTTTTTVASTRPRPGDTSDHRRRRPPSSTTTDATTTTTTRPRPEGDDAPDFTDRPR